MKFSAASQISSLYQDTLEKFILSNLKIFSERPEWRRVTVKLKCLAQEGPQSGITNLVSKYHCLRRAVGDLGPRSKKRAFIIPL